MNKKKLIILIFIIVILILMLGIGLLVASGERENWIADKLNLGEKYLDELDYEKALVVYAEILKIDPQNVDAYLGMAEVYIAMGDYEEALKILEEGFAQTGHEQLEKKLKEVEALMQVAQATPVPTEAPAATPAPTAEPTPAPTATPEPMIQVNVDLQELAQSFVDYLEEDISFYESGYEILNCQDSFGLFDFTGDGIPEMVSHAGSIAAYYKGDAGLVHESWLKYDCYYDEETKEGLLYYTWQGTEELIPFSIDFTRGETPWEWMDFGTSVTEGIDLSQYIYVDGTTYDKAANMDVATMEETLRTWFAEQETIELVEEEFGFN